MRQGFLAPYSLNTLKPLKSVLIENMGIDPRNRSKRFLAYPMDALSSVLKSHHEGCEGETGDSSFNLLGMWVVNRPTLLSNSAKTYPVSPFRFFAR